MASASLLWCVWILWAAFRSLWGLCVVLPVTSVVLIWIFCNAGWGFQLDTMVGHHQSSSLGRLSVDRPARWDLTRVRFLQLLFSALRFFFSNFATCIWVTATNHFFISARLQSITTVCGLFCSKTSGVWPIKAVGHWARDGDYSLGLFWLLT